MLKIKMKEAIGGYSRIGQRVLVDLQQDEYHKTLLATFKWAGDASGLWNEIEASMAGVNQTNGMEQDTLSKYKNAVLYHGVLFKSFFIQTKTEDALHAIADFILDSSKQAN